MNNFLIDHIDPLGQGVHKEEDKIFFIPKTLPGESGSFIITKKSKGVHFGKCTQIHNASSLRIKPECIHYEECNGCHFLHTNYENELGFKLKTYRKILSSLKVLDGTDKIKVISNHQRFKYRNRIQLHYDQPRRLLGFKKKHSKDILPIKECIVTNKNIQDEISNFTNNDAWISKMPSNSPARGHVELYDFNDKVHITWNDRYASQGFSQVNEAVNELLKQEIQNLFRKRDLKVLDLFGGGGNLVELLDCQEKLSVDLYPHGVKNAQFLDLDLFKENALEVFKKSNQQSFNTLILDPPRSGFKALDQWVNHIQPQEILYVSCQPSTMVRDLQDLINHYSIESIYMIEFFPGTHHFEGVIKLNKKLN